MPLSPLFVYPLSSAERADIRSVVVLGDIQVFAYGGNVVGFTTKYDDVLYILKSSPFKNHIIPYSFMETKELPMSDFELKLSKNVMREMSDILKNGAYRRKIENQKCKRRINV